MARGRDKFNKYKKILKSISKLICIIPSKIRIKFLNNIRMLQGNTGIAIRYILIKSLARKCGDNVSIHPNVYIFKPNNIEIGNNVSIHPMCYIDSSGGLKIGNDVSIAHNTTIMTTSHEYEDVNVPIKDQRISYKTVTIENDVWIGAKSTILAGKIIKEGSIVGAGSVVTKDVDRGSIVGGVPASKLKTRNSNIDINI